MAKGLAEPGVKKTGKGLAEPAPEAPTEAAPEVQPSEEAAAPAVAPEAPETPAEELARLEAEAKKFPALYPERTKAVAARAEAIKAHHDYLAAWPKRLAELDTAVSRGQTAGEPEHDRQAGIEARIRTLKAEIDASRVDHERAEILAANDKKIGARKFM